MPKWYFLWLFFLPFYGVCQSPSNSKNLREKKFYFQGKDLNIDTLAFFSNSLQVFQVNPVREIPDSSYFVVSGILKWRNPHFLKVGTLLMVRYRTFPLEWQKKLNSEYSVLRDSTGDFFLMGKSESESFSMAEEFRRMEYSGGFMRGLSLGNRQDLILNSQLNLQLAGEIAPGFTIRAAITDENLPIQASGNTLQLQEFDKVYLALEKDLFHFTAGDFEIQRQQSHFNNYYKKVQGLKAQFWDKANSWETTGSASFSRGQFQRLILDVTEGNQGPYRLFIPENGVFTVLLAGTEKVFINGKKATRGTSGDYIIDYNRGEILFTTNQMIVRESRIVVEFEYADASQNRSILTFQSQYKNKNTSFFIHGMTLQESKTSQLYKNLNENDLNLLANSSSKAGQVNLPGWEYSANFDPTRTYYARLDTLLPCGKRDTMFSFVSLQTDEKYLVKFGIPSSGRGNYILAKNQTGNDRIYEYLSPDPITCEPRGLYEPLVHIDLPSANRLINFGQESHLAKNLNWRSEVGISQFDNNRFSRTKEGLNIGWASWNEWKWSLPEKENRTRFHALLSHEYVKKNYSALEPIRQPDFLRDWGLTNQLGKGVIPNNDENIIKLKISVDRPKGGVFDYQIEHYLRPGYFKGIRQDAGFILEKKNTSISGNFNQVFANNDFESTLFSRPQFYFNQKLPGEKKWELTGKMEGERKVKQNRMNHNLDVSSFAFHQFNISLKSPENKSSFFAIHLQDRADYGINVDKLILNYQARYLKLEGTQLLGKNYKVKQLWQYRNLKNVIQPNPVNARGGVLLGQLQGDGSLWKGLIRSNTVYERGSGQEPRLEYTYIKVAPGEGTHIWLDSLFNKDGVLQQQEMILAPFQDQADFIRINTLNNQYLPARFLHFNQSILIDPSRFKGKLNGKLSRWQWNSTWKVDRKTQSDKGINAFNPFFFDENDPDLISIQFQQRHLLFLNKGNKQWDMQIGNQRQFQKWLQTIGYEFRGSEETFLKIRWNPSSKWLVRSEVGKGFKNQKAERFAEKNYAMSFKKANLSIQFMPSNSLRSTLGLAMEMGQPKEQSETNGDLNKWDLSWTSTWNASAGQSLQVQLSSIFVQYSGLTSSPAAFALLQGLQTGYNWQWELQFEKIIGKNLRLQGRYQGRKSANGPFIHLGNIQLGATF